MRHFIAWGVATAACAPAAMAGSASTTMTVSASVVASCSIAASPLSFGSYDGRQTDATAALAAQCTNGTTYAIGFDAGSGDAGQRQMIAAGQGGAALRYAIYSDTARRDVWGSTIGIDTVAGIGDGNAQSIPVYGRIAANQSPGRGDFQDAVHVTISF